MPTARACVAGLYLRTGEERDHDDASTMRHLRQHGTHRLQTAEADRAIGKGRGDGDVRDEEGRRDDGGEHHRHQCRQGDRRERAGRSGYRMESEHEGDEHERSGSGTARSTRRPDRARATTSNAIVAPTFRISPVLDGDCLWPGDVQYRTRR